MSTNKGKQRSDIVLEVLGQPIPNNVSLDETMSPILQLHTQLPTPVPHPPKLQVQPIALAKYFGAFPHLVVLAPAV